MKFSTTLLRFLTITVVALATTTAQADLLTNGSFETGDLTGWTLVSPEHAVGAPGVGAHSGQFAGRLNAPGDGVPEMNQSFAANPGDIFNFSGWMLTEAALPSAGATFGLLKMVFRDGPGYTGNDLQVTSASIGIINNAFPGVESIQLNSGSPVNTWIFGEIQATAPAGTQSVGFLLLTVDFGNNANHPMWFDSIQASVVPEPTTLSLLGLGMVGLLIRRRR